MGSTDTDEPLLLRLAGGAASAEEVVGEEAGVASCLLSQDANEDCLVAALPHMPPSALQALATVEVMASAGLGVETESCTSNQAYNARQPGRPADCSLTLW